MPKSNLDWLGIVSLWLGALIMTVKAADFPLLVGAPSWLAGSVWSYAPLGLITLYLLIAIYRLVRKPQPPTAEPDPREDMGGLLERRRTMITQGRKLLAAFHRQTHTQSLLEFLQKHDEWQAIRNQLDPSVVRDMEDRLHFVATNSATKDGKVYYLTKELDRLEREWGLL